MSNINRDKDIRVRSNDNERYMAKIVADNYDMTVSEIIRFLIRREFDIIEKQKKDS